MKRAVMTLCVLLLLTWSVQGQDGNLLTNPGFEPPFTSFQGDPEREVAQGWQPWHVPAAPGSPSYQNRQPEYAPTAPDEDRIRSGIDAQRVFSFFATHVGGVYQQVSGITPGSRLRFSVYVYVWSTTYDEIDISEEDGDVIVEVGIDPSGGTDSQSSTIVWSEPVEQYDAYNEYSVEAEAQNSTVTVFVRTSASVPVKHNNIFLDDASLTVAAPGGEATEEATAEPTAEATAEATTVPTATEEITVSPVPSATNTEAPTSTPVPTTEAPSSTPPPSETATQTPAPDSGIVATETPAAAETATPAPSETPVTPSGTPTATPITPTETATESVPISEQFPFTVIHTVQRNESVAILAERYGSSIEAIAEINGLGSDYRIYVEQQLIIPVRELPPTPTATGTTEVIVVTATPPEPLPPLGSDNIYIVKPGDSLTRIARLFNTTPATLAQLNGIVNPNQIQVGQQLVIPGATSTPTPPALDVIPTATPVESAGQVYIVQPGDSLYLLSIRFGVPISRIAQANNIRNTWLIYAGQRLIIP